MISLGSAYGEIQIGTDGAAQSVQSLSSTLRDFGTTMSLAVSAPLIGAATVALKSAGDFEQSMNQMQAVSGATADQMASLQSQALQLGADTSFSAGEAAQGMLELAKAGMSAKETGDAIGGVMSLAAAGNMDLAQAAEITANALNAFNLPAADSVRVADILAGAANSSSVEVTDMAQSFNMASAVFSSSGQSIDDLSTAIAILGNNGLKGSDAGTSLKTMMMRLTAPTKESAKALAELGINVYDAAGKTRAFPDILADLQQAMTGVNAVTVTSGGRTKEQTAQMKHLGEVIKQTQQKLADYQSGVAGVAQSEDAKRVSVDRLNRTLAAAQSAYNELAGIQGTSSTVMKQMTEEERNQALAMIFGSDAVRAANILIREGTDEYGKMKDAVTEQGAAAKMADANMKGFNGAIEYVKGSIDSFLISTALPFLDSFGGIIRSVGDAITALGALPAPLKNAALAFLAVFAAAGPVTLAMSGIMAVLGALFSPIGLIVIAVASLAAAWAADWGGIQEKTFTAWAQIQAIFAEATAWLATNIPVALAVLSAWWASVWPQLSAVAMSVWAQISGAVSTAWAAMQPTFSLVYAWLATNIPAALATVQAWFATVWTATPGIISAAWSTIQSTFTTLYAWLTTTIPVGMAYLQAIWSSVWGTVSPYITAAWGVIQPVLSQVYAWLVNNIPTSLAQFQAIWGASWTAAGTGVSTSWAAMQAAFNSIYSFVTVSIPFGVLYLQSIWSSVWAGISSTAATASTAITTVWNALVAVFGPSIANLTSSFSSMTAQFGTMGPQFQALWAAAQPVLQQLGMLVMGLGAVVGVVIGGAVIFAINQMAAVFQNLPAIVSVVVAQITATLNMIGTVVSGVGAIVSAIIAGNWSAAWTSAQTVVGALATFLQNTLTNAILLAGIAVNIVGSTISGFLAGLGFDGAATAVQGFIDKIVSLVGWIASLTSGEISVTLAEPEWIIALLAWAWPAIGSAEDWVTTLVAWAWPDMITVPAWITSLMDWAWPDFISQPSWVSALTSWDWPDFISAPGWVTSLLAWDWPALGLPSWLGGNDTASTGNASGTSYSMGQQYSALNERGRELVSIPSDQSILPPGSRVYTNGQSNRMMNADTGAGFTFNFYGTIIKSDQDIHKLGNQLGSLVRKQR